MSEKTHSGKLTGKHVLVMLLVFFGVVFAVNGYFISSAVKSFPGQVEDKSYLQGLKFNQTLEARRKQSQLGWMAQIGVEASGIGPRSLVSVYTNSEGAAVTGLEVIAELVRHDDRHISLVRRMQKKDIGEYWLDVSDLGPGRWTVRTVASNDAGDSFEAFKTVTLQ